MLPRFTTLCGKVAFETMAMDVSRYSGAELTAWRGGMLGTDAAYKVTCQESTDGTADSWTDCDGGTQTTIPEDDQTQISLTFVKRFFRIVVEMTTSDTSVPVATCWISGFFEQRIS
jgi:hypothetical protein